MIFEGGDLTAVRDQTADIWEGLSAAVRVPVGMASDGAECALTAQSSDDPYEAANGAAVTGYIAAMTELRVRDRAGYDHERGAQATWLRDELDL